MERNNFVETQLALAGNTNFVSQEAEEGILSAMLTHEDAVRSAVGHISEGDFHYPEYGKIFRAIEATMAKGLAVDLVTVDATVSEMFPDEAINLFNVLIECAKGGIAYWNIDSYIRIVKDLSARRKSIKSVEGIMKQLLDPSQDLDGILDKMRTESRAVESGDHEVLSMTEVMLNIYEYLEKRSKGEIQSIETGIRSVDNLVGGFFGGELTVIGARPSVGKSAFGANIALHAARKGFKTAIVSCEMTDVQFGQRIISSSTDIDGMKLRKADLKEDDWGIIAEALPELARLPVYFMFNTKTVEKLRSTCQYLVDKIGIDMLIVDYLQLMQTTKNIKEEHLRVGHISRSLKFIAKDFNIPVIALAQVNREADGGMPELKDLKSSGDIEQDADGVIFLHRPSKESDPSIDPRDREYFDYYRDGEMKYMCIGVAKQRQGVVGKACVLFDGAHMKYYPIEREMEG